MITVIGGSGFIGTRLCQNLTDHQIKFQIVDLKLSQRFPEKTTIADIRDYEALKAAVSGCSIINLAAVHRDDVLDQSLYYTTNVDGTLNVCRVAEEKGIQKIVFTSTVAVYGFAKADTGEDGPIKPFNDYGKSKYGGEEVLRRWFAEDEESRALTIVRPTVVFGEGNRGNVYNLLKQIQSGKFLIVGNGRNRKSMAYVGNIAAFLETIIEKKNGYRLYNYIDKPDFDMNTLVGHAREKLKGSKKVGIRLPYVAGLALGYLADVIVKVTNIRLPISSIRIKKFCATTTFTSTAFDTLGFRAPFTLTEGLHSTITAEFIEPDSISEVFYTE